MPVKHSPGCRCCVEGDDGICCNTINILDVGSQVPFDTSYIQSGSFTLSPSGLVNITSPLVLSVDTCCPDWVIEIEFYDTGDNAFVKVDRALQFTTSPYTRAYTPAYKISEDTYEDPCFIDEPDRPNLTYQWFQSRLSKDYKLPWTCDPGFPDSYEFDRPPFTTIDGQPIYRYAYLTFVSVFDSNFGCQREGVFGLNYLAFPDDPSAWSRGGVVPLEPRITPITIDPGSSTMVLNKIVVKYGSKGLASDITQDCTPINNYIHPNVSDNHTGDPVYTSGSATASYQYYDGLWDAAIAERVHLRTDDPFIPDANDPNSFWQNVPSTSIFSVHQIAPSASDPAVSVGSYAADIAKFEQDSYSHSDVLPDLWKVYYDRASFYGKSWLQINLSAVDLSYQNTFNHLYGGTLYDWERIGAFHLYAIGGVGTGYEIRQHSGVRGKWIESVTIVDSVAGTSYTLTNSTVSHPSNYVPSDPSTSGCLPNTVYSTSYRACSNRSPTESNGSIQYPTSMVNSPWGYAIKSQVVRMNDGTDDWFVGFLPILNVQPIRYFFSARRESDCLQYDADNFVGTTLIHSCGATGLITTNFTEPCDNASISVVWRLP